MLIDTHAHLNMPEFNDLDEVVKHAKNSSVEAIVNVSFDIDSSFKSIEIANNYDFIFASVGVHPHHADTISKESIDGLKILAKNERVVAIGETGLDYHENDVPKNVQKDAFLLHIYLAKEMSLPLIFHVREAYDDMLDIIKNENINRLNGVFHCFGENEAVAKRILDMGFLISFTGIITFKNAVDVREIVKYVPLDRLMLETDCPYLAPQIMRGKRNEPSYLKYIALKVAEIKNISYEEVSCVTSKNAKMFFDL